MSRSASTRSHAKASPRGRRRAARRPAGSGRVRALLGLGSVAFLALGFGAQGTFAFWTDSATVKTGAFSSGTLDITVAGELAGPGTLNNPGTFDAPFALPNMVPGESFAYTFPVKNNGTTPLTYTLTATGSGPLATANGMQYSVLFGTLTSAAAVNSGTPAANNRAGTCGGTVATDNNTTLLNANGPVITFGQENRNLAVGATEQVCIVARFNSNAGNALQNKTGTSASFLFSAKQVGAP